MKFYSIGGYNEVGKNMSAIEVRGEVVIIDMGLHLDKIINLSDDERKVSTKELIKIGALPNDEILKGKNVKAIVLSHGHLDHSGAVAKLSERYNCPIIGTPFTIEIVKRLLKDERRSDLIKRVKILNLGERTPISSNFGLEFVRMTHSIPQTAFVVLHTKEGIVTYLNDFKLDNNPTMGKKPDYKRIKELGRKGIKLHINECVRVEEKVRTPPEYVARILVEDALERAYDNGSAVLITTFASHIARLRNIIKANNNRRKIIMLGRSLHNYVRSAESLGLINLKDIQLHGRSGPIKTALKIVEKNPKDYLLITTGNQGEPNSVLSRIAKREYKFSFSKEDQVIFSSIVIPSPINGANRHILEGNLKEQGVRIMQDVHVSGHAAREDHRDILKMLNPEYVAPSHGETERLSSYAALASEEGYKIGDTVRIMWNGRTLEL